MSYSIEPDAAMIRSKWLIVIDSAMYRKGMLHLCRRLGQEHVSYWLHHASEHYAPNISDQAWMMEVLYPQLTGTSLRRVAIVLSKDLFLQSVIEQLCGRSRSVFKGSIQMRTFHDAESAKEWLLTEI